MKADEILDRAAAKIADGWCKEAYEDDGNVCSMGAIFSVALGIANPYLDNPYFDLSSEIALAVQALAKTMAEQYGFSAPNGWGGSTVIQVNDEYAKDVAEVVTCMEKAAANLRESGTIEE